jgi:hypothetical protein
MPSQLTAFRTLACLCAGAILGSFIRSRLPGDHLLDDSRDVVKMASGMIATLVALLIGLMVSSAKSTYDQANGGVTQIGAKVILLNRLQERYGAEAKPIRERLREGIAANMADHRTNPNVAAMGVSGYARFLAHRAVRQPRAARAA